MIRAILLILSLMSVISCSTQNKVKPLELVKAYEVQTMDSLEPSGLTLWDGEFYTVSDKHNTIYHLSFNQNKVILKPIIDIVFRDDTQFDFEGITHDEEYFYLISERSFQILKVSRDGKFQKWFPMTSDIHDAGKKAGLFQKNNAYIEGICSLGKNKFLLAAEREPRGFIEFNANTNSVKAYKKNQAVFDYQQNRSPDFTGLSCDKDLYVLDRNAYIVAKLIKKNGELVESKGYSYAHIIKQDKFKYQDMQYGHAEGLVVKGNKIYIILDNNRNPHSKNSNNGNNNSLFLELKK